MFIPTTRVRSTVSRGHVHESGVKRVPLEAINTFTVAALYQKQDFCPTNFICKHVLRVIIYAWTIILLKIKTEPLLKLVIL